MAQSQAHSPHVCDEEVVDWELEDEDVLELELLISKKDGKVNLWRLW